MGFWGYLIALEDPRTTILERCPYIQWIKLEESVGFAKLLLIHVAAEFLNKMPTELVQQFDDVCAGLDAATKLTVDQLRQP